MARFCLPSTPVLDCAHGHQKEDKEEGIETEEKCRQGYAGEGIKKESRSKKNPKKARKEQEREGEGGY